MTLISISTTDGKIGEALFFQASNETRLRCRCDPKDLLTDADCEEIGKELAEKKTSGVVRGLMWEKMPGFNWETVE